MEKTKKSRICASILAIILFISAIPGTVASADPYNGVWKSSPESVEKFNAYIASLSPEAAQLILNDEELVFMMKLDSYWEPQDIGRIGRRSILISLPLPGYAAGTYYSYNGSACTCHSTCTFELPTGWSVTNRCYNSGASGNCKRYVATGAIQCKGFADYVYYTYNGENVSSRTSVDVDDYTSISNDAAGAAALEELFSSLPIGSNVKVAVRGQSYNHSFIISAKSSTGITLYDANRAGNCKVANTPKTWIQLAGMYSGVIAAWRGL